MIDLRQFRQFIAVAETLSFRRAAERLHMAQPPLSAAIRKLEDELGVMLLARDNRGTALTPAGDAFLLEARRALEQAERAMIAARRAGAGLGGTLRLRFVDSTVNALLPPILRAFQERHPHVDFQLEEDTTAEQVLALRQDRTDAGLVVLPVPDAGDIQIEPLLRDRMVAALPDGHRLARRRRIALAELADEPWVLFAAHHGPGMHARIVSACAQAGFTPRVVQQPRQMQTTAGLVAGGIGVALMPRLFVPVQPPGITFCELKGAGCPLPYELALAYRTSSPLVDALRDTARHAVRELGLIAAT
ncbi:LysR family transcriptional regulator [Burkholderia multivorans]|uniref:LysR family transcriptional regulator n=1 Tax=Burkholderia multivorans TaxID=87883 RepID=UPI000277CC1D|nr:LysR family transcriptional regulator [Burkholderia multivorans]AJY15604.1 bacterial regulatory helix-turn-helix, lysR family protein [Burkholderia multivorans ATCC BAA-247]AVR18894.1 LysR family transcriptional regulator [Burkholderia multivorans]EJO60365.1 LysR substrate binding domain protein [Burkholderia multivorans ATCC BAA-247]MBU9493673.1 LysR family transcriptional regulator [Burkholderia multivorans]MCO1438353.1 LysR family transcriptional regulator [Burkholderia multivorans]